MARLHLIAAAVVVAITLPALAASDSRTTTQNHSVTTSQNGQAAKGTAQFKSVSGFQGEAEVVD